MRMRQVLWSGVSVAFGLTSLNATAQNQREVIASSGATSAASLGKPVAAAPVKVRAQMGDKPAAAPALTSPAPTTPSPMKTTPLPLGTDSGTTVLPYPGTMSSAVPPGATMMDPPMGAPMGAPMPVPSGAPYATSIPGSYNLGMTPLPGGPYGAPMAGSAFGWGSTRNNRWYINGEYLYWWIRDGGLPPLVTTGSPQSANVIESGNLNRAIDPNTRVLYGNAPLDNQGRSGGKFEVGRWFGECKPWAIEFGGFFLGDRSTTYHADSTQINPLSRPIIVANIPREGVDNFAQPGILAGSIDINSHNSFYGANVDWRRHVWCGCRFSVDGVLGFRYLNFNEDLNITERSTVIVDNVVAPNLNNAPVPRGLQNIITDQFKVNNNFYGGLLGLTSSYHVGRLDRKSVV
jgi:hypothetical protein